MANAAIWPQFCPGNPGSDTNIKIVIGRIGLFGLCGLHCLVEFVSLPECFVAMYAVRNAPRGIGHPANTERANAPCYVGTAAVSVIIRTCTQGHRTLEWHMPSCSLCFVSVFLLWLNCVLCRFLVVSWLKPWFKTLRCQCLRLRYRLKEKLDDNRMFIENKFQVMMDKPYTVRKTLSYKGFVGVLA